MGQARGPQVSRARYSPSSPCHTTSVRNPSSRPLSPECRDRRRVGEMAPPAPWNSIWYWSSPGYSSFPQPSPVDSLLPGSLGSRENVRGVQQNLPAGGQKPPGSEEGGEDGTG